MNAMFKHFQSTSGEAALEKYDQDDNIMSPRTSDISAAFDLTAKVIVLMVRITYVFIPFLKGFGTY